MNQLSSEERCPILTEMPPPETRQTVTDFLRSQEGSTIHKSFWQKRALGRWVDALFDWRLRLNVSLRKYRQDSAQRPTMKILVVGVEVPSRSADLQQVFSRLRESRHIVTCVAAPLHEGLGKFQNINRALGVYSLEDYDWLVVTDDDIDMPDNFLDTMLDLAMQEDIKICMPAHRFHSHFGFLVTLRHWKSLVRITHFVECGPLTAFHRDAFIACVPFPELRWAWATDVAWSQMAWDRGMRIGVVDACAVEHLRPVGASYSVDEALAEGEDYLQQVGVHRSRAEFLRNVRSVCEFR